MSNIVINNGNLKFTNKSLTLAYTTDFNAQSFTGGYRLIGEMNVSLISAQYRSALYVEVVFKTQGEATANSYIVYRKKSNGTQVQAGKFVIGKKSCCIDFSDDNIIFCYIDSDLSADTVVTINVYRLAD